MGFNLTDDQLEIICNIGLIILAVLFLLIFCIIGIYDIYLMLTSQPPLELYIHTALNKAPGAFILDIICVGASVFTPFVMYGIYHCTTNIIKVISKN